MKTQGTELYFLDPAGAGSVVLVGCPTSIEGIDTTVEQNEITCLSDLVRHYEAGLPTPGTMNFGIYTNPKDASHLRLRALKILGTTLDWAIGWSDGNGIPPTKTGTSPGTFDFTLPATRSWLKFDGFVTAFPFSFQQNASVQSSIVVQVTGEPTFVAKT